MPRGRTQSREFKLELMHQLASGAKRPVQICRKHGLANSAPARWRHECAERFLESRAHLSLALVR